MSEKRVCLNCAYELTGRSDQKYCSDGCRNEHHNQEKSNASNFVRQVNNTLRKNRKVLELLCPYDKAKSSKNKMAIEGFNFNYHTNKYITKKGQEYLFCYDYGYLELENDEVIIVKRKDYVA